MLVFFNGEINGGFGETALPTAWLGHIAEVPDFFTYPAVRWEPDPLAGGRWRGVRGC